MRIALLLVVVAVHLLVIWLFMASRRAVYEEELAFASILMLPEPKREPKAVVVPKSHAGRNRAPGVESAVQPTVEENTSPEAAPAPAPDWRAQAEITAQSSARQIVAEEDDARRRANALTAPYKPMPGPRERGHAFAWDAAPKHHFTAIGHGAYVLPLSDQCAIVFIIVPFFGCSLGPKPAANGDLFKYMRGPVKYGDWDWRVQDP